MQRVVSTNSDYTVRDQERMTIATQYFDWQRRMAVAHLGTRVLEVGCGVGNFTQHLLDRACVVGIDIDPNCIVQHRTRFREHRHVHSAAMDVLDDSFVETIRGYSPDSVVCLNVLEHISDDYQTLRNMHSVLPRGGHAVFMVPAFEALYGPIDANLGHYRRYSKASMRKVAESTGFNVLKLRYVNSIGFVGWWMNARILKKTEQSEAQIRLFDSRIVPILSAVEDRIEPPFGQSVFAVLERA
jgi:2-polyprenyl-3-methyl-5-hydroxy-6-metoxy-1,4-benzoquinol methylase